MNSIQQLEAEVKQVPGAILAAGVSLFAPFCPGLTPERLRSAITFQPEGGKIESLITRRNTAQALGVSTVSVDRMLRDGQLPRRRIRGRVLIPSSAIEAIISGGGSK